MNRKRIFVCLLALVAFAFLLPSSASSALQPARASILIDRAGGVKNGVEVTLQADKAAAPGETVNLTLEAKMLVDTSNLVIHWVIPDGATLIGDPDEAIGAVAAGQTATSSRAIRFSSGGIYKVAAAASYSPGPDMQFGASGVLFFAVSARSPRVSDLEPGVANPMYKRVAEEVRSAPSGEESRAANGCFNITVQVVRIDRPTNTGGYGANQVVPVTNALVEVMEEDTLFDDTYVKGITDSDGAIKANFCADDGVFDDELEIYFRLTAEIYVNGHLVAEVENNPDFGIESNYEFETEPFDTEGGTYDRVMRVDQDIN